MDFVMKPVIKLNTLPLVPFAGSIPDGVAGIFH
jgi:hypothetical protein